MIRPWKKQLGLLTFLAVLSVGMVSVAQAASAPNVFTYQGRVLNANGVPVSDTSLSMSFALYTASTGGTCVWSNSSATCASVTARSVTLTTGLFTENLGDTSVSYAAISDSIFGDNATLYLEVIIAGETLVPRRQVTAAPYALNADTLDGIDSTVLQLFETGSSRTFEDDAPVIIGSNAAFTYGSGATGDLRVEDEFEVMGDGFIDNDLVIGASTSSTETISHSTFSLGGDDLFVAGTLGVEGVAYSDGGFTAGTDTTLGSGSITTTGTTDLSLTIAGGDLTFAQNTIIGDNGDVLSIDSSDWDISTTGDLTGIGSITMDGDLTVGGDNLDSAGAPLVLNATAADEVRIGTGTPGIATGAGDLYVTDVIEIDGAADIRGSLSTTDFLGVTTNTSVNVQPSYSGTLGAQRNDYGNYSLSTSTVDRSGNSYTVSGFTGVGQYSGTAGGPSELNGVYGAGVLSSSSSTAPLVLGLKGEVTSSVVGGTITDARAMYGNIGISSGSVTTAYGGYFASTAAGSTARYGAYARASTDNGGNATTLYGADVIAEDGSSGNATTAYGIRATASGATTTNISGYFYGSRVQIDDNTTVDTPTVATGSGDLFVLSDIEADGNLDIAGTGTFRATTDITSGSNEDLTIIGGGTGDLILSVDGDSSVQVVASGSPAIDLLNITGAGNASTTNGVDALYLEFGASNASGSIITMLPSFTGGASDNRIFRAFEIQGFSPTNSAGTDTITGIHIESITDPGATISSVALSMLDGWDTNISFQDTTVQIQISDLGVYTFEDASGNDIFVLSDVNTATNHVLTGDADTGLVLSGMTTDVTTGTNETLTLTANGTGDVTILGDAATDFVYSDGTNTLLRVVDDGTSGLMTIGFDSAATSNGVCHSGADIDAAGDASPMRDIVPCSGSVDADYAEKYPVVSGVGYGDIVVPGTVGVTTSDGDTVTQLIKSSRAYQGPVVGIVSNNYGDFTSAGNNIAQEDNPMPVALVGRVSVKVTAEEGSIFAGDYLTTSSTAGKAMKATKVGRVIGMALEDWDGVSETVMVQVHNSWSMGDVLGTDGTSTLVTNNIIVSSVGTATAFEPTFDSYGLALRGSAWNGSEAAAVEMMLRNVVDTHNDYRLSVRNTAETEVAYITNEGTIRIAGDMVIGGRLYPSDRGTPQTEKYIYYDGSPGPGGDFMRTNATGWSTGSYDFAEMFPSGEELTSGDVVVFAGTGEIVHRATGTQGEQLAGIVSTRPGFLAGENVAGAYPIALAGRVPTKVSTANGAITVGDPLTSSTTAGVAMKASEAGQIIGYALERYTGSESDNLILVYVNVGYWSGDPQIITIVQNQASQVSSDAQSFSALNMSGNIYMATNQILSIGRLEGVSALWSVEADGTIKTGGSLKTVTESYQGTKVETVAVTSPESVITLTGTATLSSGRAEVRFEDVVPEYNDVISAIAPIRVIVTPSGSVSLYVSEKDQNHFVVERFAGSADVEFDWMVTGYRKGYEPEEEVVEVDQVEPAVAEALAGEEVEEVVLPDEEEEIIEEESQPAIEEKSAISENSDGSLIDPSIEGENLVAEIEPFL